MFFAGLFAAAKGLRDSYNELAEKGTTRDAAGQMLDFGDFNAMVSVLRA